MSARRRMMKENIYKDGVLEGICVENRVDVGEVEEEEQNEE